MVHPSREVLTMLKYRLHTSVAAVAALTLSAAPAFAAPPQPVDQTIPLPAGVACAFPIELVLTGKTKTIALPGGRTIITAPGQNVTVTNQDNGRSVTLNITGAFHVTTERNGDVVTVATGRNALLDPVAGFVLTEGNVTFAFDATKTGWPRSRVTVICALIA
jgi:hypothetical protein